MSIPTTTTYFMSMCVPVDAMPLVYDSHETLAELTLDQAVGLFGDPKDLHDVWERKGWDDWRVVGIETTESVERCRFLFGYQRDRIEASGYPVLRTTDEFVVATTKEDESHRHMSWHYAFVRDENHVWHLCEVFIDKDGDPFGYVTLDMDVDEAEFTEVLSEAVDSPKYTEGDFS